MQLTLSPLWEIIYNLYLVPSRKHISFLLLDCSPKPVAVNLSRQYILNYRLSVVRVCVSHLLLCNKGPQHLMD